MEKFYLKDIFLKPISGEWGNEVKDDEKGYPVIRTTNFTNAGEVNYDELAYRDIDISIKKDKLLKRGDIIIEKSGGTPKTPVGRVVYFDIEDENYFTNNFTAILRTKNGINSKYVFYMMNYLHKIGVVLKYQNKTTGILNLKLSDYLKNTKIKLPQLNIQNSTVDKLDKLKTLIQTRQDQIQALDDLVESVLYNFLNNYISNQVDISEVLVKIISGKSLAGDAPSNYRVLKTSCLYSGYFDENEWKYLPVDYTPSEDHFIKKDDILVSRMNTEELVGANVYVWKNYPNLTNPDRIWRLITNDKINNIYLWKLMQTNFYKNQIYKISTGTSGSMKNISQKNFADIKIILPPISQQNLFAAFVEKIEKQKQILNDSLGQLRVLFDSLMQDAFDGSMSK